MRGKYDITHWLLKQFLRTDVMYMYVIVLRPSYNPIRFSNQKTTKEMPATTITNDNSEHISESYTFLRSYMEIFNSIHFSSIRIEWKIQWATSYNYPCQHTHTVLRHLYLSMKKKPYISVLLVVTGVIVGSRLLVQVLLVCLNSKSPLGFLPNFLCRPLCVCVYVCLNSTFIGVILRVWTWTIDDFPHNPLNILRTIVVIVVCFFAIMSAHILTCNELLIWSTIHTEFSSAPTKYIVLIHRIYYVNACTQINQLKWRAR